MTDKPIPPGYHTVNPSIVVRNVAGLIDFIRQVFDARETERMQTPDGRIVHAEVRLGDSVIMLGEASGEFTPMPASLYLYLDDCDEAYRRAIDAGATSLREPADQYYGDRSAGVQDAFGNQWWMATRIEEVSAEELERRANVRNVQA